MGSFDNYKDPKLLAWFCKYLLQGPKQIKNLHKQDKVGKNVSAVAQHIVQAFRSNRQITHDSDNFRVFRETPLSIGTSLYVHRKFRSKLLVEFLYDLNIGASYEKTVEIEEATADNVIDNMDKNGFYSGFVFPNTDKNFHWFALDNIDFLEDTPTGTNTTHATGIAMFCDENGNTIKKMPLKLQRPPSKNYTKDNDFNIQCCKLTEEKPKKKIDIELSQGQVNDANNLKDFSWVLGCLNLDRLRESGIPGTWGAFNSLASSKPPPKTSVLMVPPLIRWPPTDLSVFYTSLMSIKNISNNLNKDGMLTVVTLDMQLYDLSMKLWCDVDHISESFLFRPGELHIIFWALASVGDYIEASGLDQAWVEAGMYSATTVTNQILKGKHMYRALECHFVTLISIYTLFFEQFLIQFPDDYNLVRTLSEQLRDAYKGDSGPETETNDDVLRVINEDSIFFDKIVGLAGRIETFKNDMNPIQNFLFNYVKQFETILLFIRATRDRDIELHLQSLESLIKYFFAHDHLNYARLLPMYLATMQNVKKNHQDLWKEFMDGKFCVSKSNVKFTSIGPDHGIEQENRRLKVTGGIVGITQNDHALQRFFLAAPVLSVICKEFEHKFGLNSRNSSSRYHDLHRNKPKRIQKNVESLCRVITQHGDPFTNQDERLFNILTHALMDEKVQ